MAEPELPWLEGDADESDAFALPPHRADGTLPPHLGERMVRTQACAPYRLSPAEVLRRFGESRARTSLADGWLRLRRELHAMGLDRGFQWIGGSFVEATEQPSDVDVVTFFVMPPAWRDRAERQRVVKARPDLFRPTEAKARFGCDAYFVALGMQRAMFRSLCLWYALLSHDRETLSWKGFVEVDLAPGDGDQKS